MSTGYSLAFVYTITRLEYFLIITTITRLSRLLSDYYAYPYKDESPTLVRTLFYFRPASIYSLGRVWKKSGIWQGVKADESMDTVFNRSRTGRVLDKIPAQIILGRVRKRCCFPHATTWSRGFCLIGCPSSKRLGRASQARETGSQMLHNIVLVDNSRDGLSLSSAKFILSSLVCFITVSFIFLCSPGSGLVCASELSVPFSCSHHLWNNLQQIFLFWKVSLLWEHRDHETKKLSVISKQTSTRKWGYIYK